MPKRKEQNEQNKMMYPYKSQVLIKVVSGERGV